MTETVAPTLSLVVVYSFPCNAGYVVWSESQTYVHTAPETVLREATSSFVLEYGASK